MNSLHRAFQVLGLEPGTAFLQVKKRYRRLVVVWHPDRMNNEEARKEAEEELKKINDAFEKLKKHFDSQHVNGPGCSCQPSAASNTSANRSNPNHGSSRTRSSKAEAWEKAKKEAEAAAKSRSEERARQQKEENDRREAEQAAKRAAEFQTAVNEAMDNEALWKEERLRWRVALGLLVVFVGLIGFYWLGCGAKALAKNVETQWKKIIEPPKKQAPKSEPIKKTRTIKIYNEYCPHHHTHEHSQKHRKPPTLDPYFPGSKTWNYRLDKKNRTNDYQRRLAPKTKDYFPFAPPAPPPE